MDLLHDDALAAALLFLDTDALLTFRCASKRSRRMFAGEGHARRHLRRLLVALHASEQELRALSVLHAGAAAKPLAPKKSAAARPSRPATPLPLALSDPAIDSPPTSPTVLPPSSPTTMEGSSAPVSSLPPTAMLPAMAARKVLNIGHKGAEGHVKGNTIASFVEAVRLGADVIEFDVLTCADGTVVCHHDPLVEATGEWYDTMSLERARRHLPKLCTLEETLRCRTLIESTVHLYFDLKHTNIVRPTLRAIQRAVAEWGWAPERLIVASFKQRELLEVNAWRRALPELRGLRTAVILDAVPVSLARDFEALGVEAVSVGKFCVFEDFVVDCHRRGLAMWVWTVNSRPLMERLISQGVDGVCSDFPDMVCAARDKVLAEEAIAAAQAAAAAASTAALLPQSLSMQLLDGTFGTRGSNGDDAAGAVLEMIYHALSGVRNATVAAVTEAKLVAAVAARDAAVGAIFGGGNMAAAATLAEVVAAVAAAEEAAATVLQPVVLSAETFTWAVALLQTEEGRALMAGVAATLARAPHQQPRMLPFERSWLETSSGAVVVEV